jgi:2-oxoglutarate ferredoxin oxidoreductase subunit beta
VSDKIMINTMHGLHGRSLPLASGIHLANPNIPVFAMAGDGATMSEGVNHLIHTARNNYNITFLLNNNHNYGLTTGQASATTPK